MRKIKRKMMVNSWNFGEHESWFSDMAKEGWHLRKVGGVFAHFELKEPKDTQYRIDTSSNKKMSEADKEMFQEAGWQHVTKLGEFNVFSSPTELQAPELHTDPVEQAYTLKDLAKKLQRSTIQTIILCILGVAMASAFWFIDKTPTLTVVRGDFQLVVLLLILVFSLFTVLQSNLSIRRLRKELQEGKAINHNAPWRKKRRLPLVISSILITVLSANLVMVIAQAMLGNTETLPVKGNDLPIIRLADIEQNPDLMREEHFVEEQLDMLNRYSYNWSPIAPLQYEAHESGIIPGQLWPGEDITYSPGLRTEVYRLNFPSLSEKLIADLVRRHIYDGDAVELESNVFDSLFIQEREGSQEIFAAKGKGVMYVAYYGYAETSTILSMIEEKIALIEN